MHPGRPIEMTHGGAARQRSPFEPPGRLDTAFIRLRSIAGRRDIDRRDLLGGASVGNGARTVRVGGHGAMTLGRAADAVSSRDAAVERWRRPCIRTCRAPSPPGYSGASLAQSSRAVHPRHHDVRQDQVDRALVPGADADRIEPVGGLQHVVPVLLEDLPDQPPDHLRILHEEDRLSARGRNGAACRDRRRLRVEISSTRGRYMRKVVPFPGSLCDRDVAAALLHDPVYRGEAEPGSLPLLLRGEKRLEDVGDRPADRCRTRCRAISRRL